MPNLSVIAPEEAPYHSLSDRKNQETMRAYEEIIRRVEATKPLVGQLIPVGEEGLRSIKVRLRRAATRIGNKLTIWDDGDSVYFKVV